MRYRITRNIDRSLRKDDLIHSFEGCTYGCISEEGTACTIEGERFLEVPTDALVEFPDEAITPLHVKEVCRPGCGDETCRYLIVGGGGWRCAKFSSLHPLIAERSRKGTMNAKGDNCEGRSGVADPHESTEDDIERARRQIG